MKTDHRLYTNKLFSNLCGFVGYCVTKIALDAHMNRVTNIDMITYVSVNIFILEFIKRSKKKKRWL